MLLRQYTLLSFTINLFEIVVYVLIVVELLISINIVVSSKNELNIGRFGL